MGARLSAIRAGRFLPPGRLLVLISIRGWVNLRAIVWLEGLGKLKKSTSSGTQTNKLPACSIAPQPITLSCASVLLCHTNLMESCFQEMLLNFSLIFSFTMDYSGWVWRKIRFAWLLFCGVDPLALLHWNLLNFWKWNMTCPLCVHLRILYEEHNPFVCSVLIIDTLQESQNVFTLWYQLVWHLMNMFWCTVI
jgi:hypothetical protein